jgi:hypothetical protein
MVSDSKASYSGCTFKGEWINSRAACRSYGKSDVAARGKGTYTLRQDGNSRRDAALRNEHQGTDVVDVELGSCFRAFNSGLQCQL